MRPPVGFVVRGIPQTQGSKKGFFNKGLGRVLLVDDNKRNKPWRADVVAAATVAMGEQAPFVGPVRLRIVFTLPRPKNHHKGGKGENPLKASAPYWHTSKPDATKMLRSVEDALKGIVWADDSQVASQIVTKAYGDKPGATVIVEELTDVPTA